MNATKPPRAVKLSASMTEKEFDNGYWQASRHEARPLPRAAHEGPAAAANGRSAVARQLEAENYITPSGLHRLKDEHRFLLTRERPALTEVVAWAAGNGERSENADYQ
jgi:hypothetical protein